jgi:hypothetical protein
MPDRIRLQQRASAAVSQSHDLSIRAHGADSAPGEHNAAFRGVNGAGVEGLTGAHRALSHGVSSFEAGHGVGPYSPGLGPVCPQKSDRGVMPDASPESGVSCASRAAERVEQIGACACILVAIACALFDAPHWLGRLFIAWGWA